MKSEVISSFLSERIEAEDFPSAVYLVAERGEIRFADALGFAVRTDALEIPAQLNTIYDLASLTKVLVTGLLCARLIESRFIKLEDPISKFPLHNYYGDIFSKKKSNITIKNLLTHTSGFTDWLPLYLHCFDYSMCEDGEISLEKFSEQNNLTYKGELDSDRAVELIDKLELEYQTNEGVKYSDLNFILLGILIEKVRNQNLHKCVEQTIFSPLNLSSTYFNPPDYMQYQIAACEFGNEYEKQICLKMGYDQINPETAFRKNLIWGEVHDGNCYFMGGDSGHAGLFSTAEDVFKIALQFLPRTTTLLKPETCELFKTNFTGHLNNVTSTVYDKNYESRSFAFQLAETNDSTAGNALANNSFGHLGFTGTSLWIEPDTERIFILLTNRTHHPLPFVNINSTRRRFHELAVQELDNL